jgi:hypothetical protein
VNRRIGHLEAKLARAIGSDGRLDAGTRAVHPIGAALAIELTTVLRKRQDYSVN